VSRSQEGGPGKSDGNGGKTVVHTRGETGRKTLTQRGSLQGAEEGGRSSRRFSRESASAERKVFPKGRTREHQGASRGVAGGKKENNCNPPRSAFLKGGKGGNSPNPRGMKGGIARKPVTKSSKADQTLYYLSKREVEVRRVRCDITVRVGSQISK